MDFIVIGRDGTDPGAPARRQAARTSHLEHARDFFERGEWLDAAALLDEGGAMVGSVILCRFDSRAELDRWIAREPYVTREVWKSVEVIGVRVPPPFARLHDLRRMDLTFTQRTEEFSVCRAGPGAAIPEWLLSSSWYSITRSERELSIVCESTRIPAGARAEHGWAMLEVEGPIPFATTGVLGRIASLLAAAEISLFVLSTFDSDAVLVRRDVLDDVIRVFRAAGATVG